MEKPKNETEIADCLSSKCCKEVLKGYATEREDVDVLDTGIPMGLPYEFKEKEVAVNKLVELGIIKPTVIRSDMEAYTLSDDFRREGKYRSFLDDLLK
ncbi:hypothetical protein KY312_03030 [Candidatus Woesearchaeota archaeon]|nr:hypothetical protein [Candidatus Woesearchaeota archaeon]